MPRSAGSDARSILTGACERLFSAMLPTGSVSDAIALPRVRDDHIDRRLGHRSKDFTEGLVYRHRRASKPRRPIARVPSAVSIRQATLASRLPISSKAIGAIIAASICPPETRSLTRPTTCSRWSVAPKFSVNARPYFTLPEGRLKSIGTRMCWNCNSSKSPLRWARWLVANSIIQLNRKRAAPKVTISVCDSASSPGTKSLVRGRLFLGGSSVCGPTAWPGAFPTAWLDRAARRTRRGRLVATRSGSRLERRARCGAWPESAGLAIECRTCLTGRRPTARSTGSSASRRPASRDAAVDGRRAGHTALRPPAKQNAHRAPRRAVPAGAACRPGPANGAPWSRARADREKARRIAAAIDGTRHRDIPRRELARAKAGKQRPAADRRAVACNARTRRRRDESFFCPSTILRTAAKASDVINPKAANSRSSLFQMARQQLGRGLQLAEKQAPAARQQASSTAAAPANRAGRLALGRKQPRQLLAQ